VGGGFKNGDASLARTIVFGHVTAFRGGEGGKSRPGGRRKRLHEAKCGGNKKIHLYRGP